MSVMKQAEAKRNPAGKPAKRRVRSPDWQSYKRAADLDLSGEGGTRKTSACQETRARRRTAADPGLPKKCPGEDPDLCPLH
jgi:hypothetical protein